MALLLTLVALLVSLLLFVARRRHGYWQRRGIPHDVPHPLFGNIKDWPKKRHIAKIFRDYYLKYKSSDYPFAGFYFFFTKTAVITDLELVKRVMIKDFNHFENRGIFYNEIDDPLSATVFSIEGQKWRHLRHKLTPTFTSGKMKNMFPIVVGVGEELDKVFSGKITSGQGQVLEIVDLVARYTADVIGNCAFGLNCNSLHNPRADFVTIGKRAIIERRYGGMLDFILFGFPKLSRRLRLKLNVQEVTDFYTKIVRDTVDYRLKTKEKRHDLMDSLIEMYQKEQAGNSEDGLTFNEILAQAFIFFVAGFETSSTTMGFALYELARNQDIQDKVRKEIYDVLGKHNHQFTYEGIKEMKYLEQVVMETLRKYPVLAHLTRMTGTDFSPEDPKYFIAKGTVVVIPALGIHYDPDIYPEPEKFKPERFTEEAIAARPSCTWLPFGEGPRNCIGLRFGLMQACVGLAHLIRGYKFSVAPETQIPMKVVVKNILISAENGIHLRVEKLSNVLKMAVLLGLLVGALALAAWWVLQNYTYWRRRGIPHDPPHIPFGNSKELWRTMQLAQILKRTYLKFKNQTDGPYVGFYLYAMKYIVITDIDFVKTVLIRDFDKFHDRGVYHNERDDPLTSNLATMEGEKWKNLRHKLTPTFRPGKMKNMFPTVLSVGEELIRVIDERISSSPQTLEVTDLVARFTADVIGICAFGLECNSLRDPKAEFVQMGYSALRERRHGWLVDFLIFGAPKLAVKLGLQLLLPRVQVFYMSIVSNTIDYRVRNEVTLNDLMDLLIELKLKSDNGDRQTGLTFNEVAAQVFTFFLAGFEAGSTTMGFALYELACNQDVQENVRTEVDRVLREHNGRLDYDSMLEMTYLDKVVNETLRKHPVVAHLVRIATKSYVHSSPKYSIEPGTGVMVPILGIHHDPEFYPEPEKFIPERFDEEQIKKRPACAFLPFGAGPRNCIGFRLGRMQVIIGLALLIRNFRFELHPTKTSVPIKYKIKNLLLSSEGGISLNVSKVVRD
ncbi:uncharacterized protein LOC108030172 [Drosophila biarmipes]|uniref:uncharacterized protein LOC108030172 n=1 Tax=Drosophila biarmipes TaxID=125945 RepID=UPI0021CCA58B|nr:uncharacterized protein LOC108030172 [Drosophila biarmipes]